MMIKYNTIKERRPANNEGLRANDVFVASRSEDRAFREDVIVLP